MKYWIVFWFNDYTRVLLVLFGGHLLLTAPLTYAILLFIGLPAEHWRLCFVFPYLSILGWALLDNDYSKLRRYGRNEYGKKITNSNTGK